MSIEENIDRYLDAFAEVMTPDENGVPIAPIESLKSLFKTLGLPEGEEPTVAKQVDPDSSGYFEFTAFLKACEDLLDSKGSQPRKRRRSEIHDADEIEDDSDDPSYEEETEEHGGETSSHGSNPAISGDSGGEISAEKAFAVLSQGGDHITVESLARVSQLINVPASQSDLRRMVELVSTKEEFKKLWK